VRDQVSHPYKTNGQIMCKKFMQIIYYYYIIIPVTWSGISFCEYYHCREFIKVACF
jgi:hypothetical protein